MINEQVYKAVVGARFHIINLVSVPTTELIIMFSEAFLTTTQSTAGQEFQICSLLAFFAVFDK